MAKKVFTDESLATLVSEIKAYTDDAVSKKADSSHKHDAYVNQNAFSNIKVGSTTVAADTATDTVTFAGSNVTITPDATNDKITFKVADATADTKGVVQLVDSTNNTATDKAASANAVNKAYTLAGTANNTANSAKTTAESKSTVTSSTTNGNIKIDGTETTVYTHPTTAGNKHIPTGGSNGQVLKWSASGTATWGTDANTTYTFGTGDNNGTIKVTPSGGSAQNIAVKGLGSAAYTESSAYAASSHAHDDKYYTKAQIDGFITIADIDNICVDSIARYTVVNSIDEMTDTNKAYILASTGHIWIYKQGGNTTTETVTEQIVATTDNPWASGRLGSSGGVSTQAGYVVTPYIDLSKYPIPFEIHLGGIQFTGQTYNTCSIFKADKTFIYRHDTNAGGFITNWRNTTFTANGDGTGKVTVSGQPIDHSNNVIGHVRFTGYGESANANIYVTYEKTTTTSSGWIDTGASQSSTSSASRQQIVNEIDAELVSVIGTGEVV